MSPQFQTVVVQTPAERAAVERLRYDVFVKELGGDGPLVDHVAQRERDRYDTYAGHLLLLDNARPDGDRAVGTYRFMTEALAQKAGQFYCEDEYDLTLLRQSGKGLLELGRSCMHPDYRGGPGMLHLWAALADYVQAQDIDVIFGVASFHGADITPYKHALSLLHDKHLAPPALRVQAKGPTAFSLTQVSIKDLDRVAAVKALPALIKGYLRLGAVVGEGGFVDHAFNTVDICIILERDAIDAMRRTILQKSTLRA